MTNKTAQNFDIRFPVAFGSGLATALLFVGALRQGTIIGLIVASLSPLPIMIATLGFGHAAGLGAAAAAALTIAALGAAAAHTVISVKIALAAGIDGAIFAAALALPAWWLAWLATRGRSRVVVPGIAAALRRLRRLPSPETEPETAGRSNYPFGDILLSVAVVAFGLVVASTLAFVLNQPSYEAGLAKAVAAVEPLIAQMLGPRELPKSLDLTVLTRLVVETMPATLSGFIALALAANLWLAGRVVELSHRLPYPWPDLPHDLRLPRAAAPLFIICLGLAFLHGLAGVIASSAAAALGILFVLQGLAVLHDLSRGMRFRGFLLGGLYLALALLLPWPLVVLLVIGLVEAGFGLRDRKAATLKNV